MTPLWLTLTGQRCPNCWFIHGENMLGVPQSREVRCTRPRGHAGPCSNHGAMHFPTTRKFPAATGTGDDRDAC